MLRTRNSGFIHPSAWKACYARFGRHRPRSDGIFPRMRRILILLLCVMAFSATLLLVGCAGGSQGQEGGHEDHTTHHQGANIKLTLRPEHNSGVSGTASFEDTSDGILVKLNLRNLPEPNTLYLAHIHPGTCAEGETHEHGGAHGAEGHGNEHGNGARRGQSRARRR